MSERGVFAVDRGIWADTDFADEAFSEREAFLWLISEAAWRPTRVRIGHHQIDLARGQCAFSTRFMAEKWKWSEARVRRYLGRLISAEIICTRTDKIATHITIQKYDKFQRVSLPDAEIPTHTRRTSDAHATHLRRKEEDREYKEDTVSSLRSETPKRQKANAKVPLDREWRLGPEEIASAASCGVSAPRAASIWPGFIDHHLKEASRFADWPAAWRTWCRNDVKFSARDQQRSARASHGRQSSADLWASDAIDAHFSRQRGPDDQGPSPDRRDGPRSPSALQRHPRTLDADGGTDGLFGEQPRTDPRQLPPLRLVGGMRSDW